MFFSPAKEPGQRLGARAVQALLLMMTERGIDTHLGHKLKGMSPVGVQTEGGDIPADLILFMPGLTGPAWAADAGLPLSPGGLIQSDERCRVAGWDKVYVAGDSGSFPGADWQPKQAHTADIQAGVAVKNLLADLSGADATHVIRSELLCIIDTGTHGALVARTSKLNVILPPSRLWHWVKRAFERRYMNKYR